MHDLVCKTDEERNRVKVLFLNTTDYIIENDFYLLDVTGKPTSWGFWGYKELNENPVHYSERLLNSIEWISMLSISYHYTKD